jgi:class 3 adenylate cyclase
MNLNTKFILSFLSLSLLSISTIAYGVYFLSIEVFYQKFIEHHFNVAKHIANSIQGEKHTLYKDQKYKNDPDFKHYFNYLRKVTDAEENITFLFTLNYDKNKKDYSYAIDPYEIKFDTIWVESIYIGFEVYRNDSDIIFIKHDNYSYSSDFKIEQTDRNFQIEFKQENEISKILVNKVEILKYDHNQKKWFSPSTEILPSEESSTNLTLFNQNLRFSYYFSLKNSDSSPIGGEYQEKLNSIEILQKALETKEAAIMPEPKQIAYGNYLIAAAPILNSLKEAVGVVVLEISDRTVRDYKNSVYVLFFTIGLIFSVFSVLLSYFLARYLTKPIIALSVAASQIADGNMSVRVLLNRKDEIGFLAKSFNTMAESVESAHGDLSNTNKAYSKFVPKEFLSLLGKKSILDVKLTDQVQKDMTILFTDIRSFTTLSEKMTPEENFNFLNSYLRRVGPIIRQNSGFIDKYIGDAIMALFPLSPVDAVKSSVEILKEIELYNISRLELSLDPISLGIGIHTGKSMLGTIGENERMEGTVISDAVNLASRIENLTKLYGCDLLISETVLKSISESTYNYRMIDNVIVKGKQIPIAIFEILDGYKEEVKEKFLATKGDFELGILSYTSREFSRAIHLFKKVLDYNPYDKVSRLYITRTEKAIKLDLSDDWDGIEILTHK